MKHPGISLSLPGPEGGVSVEMKPAAKPALHPAQIRPVCQIIAALRDGLGVEDMAARMGLSRCYVSQVLSQLRTILPDHGWELTRRGKQRGGGYLLVEKRGARR